MTDATEAPIDPHGLLVSGEELATEGELAKLLGVPRTALHSLLHCALYELVRFVRMPKPGTWRYSVADARRAIEAHRADIAERRRLADERQASEVAAAEARREAKATAHEAHVARKRGRASTRPVSAPEPSKPRSPQPRRSSAPEVIVRRRPGAGGGVRTWRVR